MNETRAIRTELGQLSEKTPIRLPLAVLFSLVITIAGAGTTYGVMKTRTDSMERRIEKLEEATLASQKLLERIDERTGTAAKTMDEIKTQIAAHIAAKP